MHAVTLLWAVDQAQASDIPGKYSTRELHLSTTIFSLKKKINFIKYAWGRSIPWHTTEWSVLSTHMWVLEHKLRLAGLVASTLTMSYPSAGPNLVSSESLGSMQ